MVSVSFLGLWTNDLPAMRRLYVEAYGLGVIHETATSVWFALDDRAELHLYSFSDDYHAFFGAAPVPGLLVEDFAKAVRELDRLKVEWLTDTSSADGRQWRHYRAADGNVYEVMGPLLE
jgi:catechol 2,3-dioxygenase-like lactoylglutathione lyase family enzyme